MAANPQQQFGNYQLLKKLATGGMAEVFLARQVGIEGFNRHVVIKRILPHLAEDREFVDMFLNEARIAARFSHPNIAQIFDLGQSEGTYYIAMEFVHGEDLGRLMRKAWSTGQWIARPLAIRIVADACAALHYAHAAKDENQRPLRVVHRDISPQNILISFDGSVKLVDFGIAKAADQPSLTKSGAIKGKFAYMAPEQAGGKPLDMRTDVFALGLVLYELLTGVRPLKRDSELATLQAALECAIEAPSAVAEVPGELDDVVMRALAKAPDDRYRDARQFQMALEEFLIGQRMVATSAQVSELMETLFADRLEEEARLGTVNPASAESMSQMPAVPAPPPPPARRAPEPPRRNPSRADLRPQDSEEQTGTDMGEALRAPVEDWEAPAAEPIQPSRRYSAPRPSSPEATRARPATGASPALARTVDEDPPERATPAARSSRTNIPRRKTGSQAQLPAVQDQGEEQATEAVPPLPPPRRTSSSAVRRRESQTGMPEAPKRQSRQGLRAVDESVELRDPLAPPPGAESALRRYDLEALKNKQRGNLRTFVIAMAVLAAAGLAFIFRGQISWPWGPGKQIDDGVPILLSVTTTPSAHIYVRRPAELRKAGEPELIDLGMTPLDMRSGAHVQDTLVLINEDNCISREELIQFGQPNEHKIFSMSFDEGELRLEITPPSVGKKLEVWCFGRKVAATNLPVKLFEGRKHLELRGEQLKGPVVFDVNVVAKKITTVKIDLRRELASAAAPEKEKPEKEKPADKPEKDNPADKPAEK